MKSEEKNEGNVEKKTRMTKKPIKKCSMFSF